MKILASFHKYNANSRNRNTSDCVKRSLSLAYGLDYDDVGKELNIIKNHYGYDRWNIKPVFDKFIANHSFSGRRDARSAGLNEDVTVAEFSELFSEGTYLLLVGKAYGKFSHMVCIINGDIYDSWDCSNYIVNYIYEVNTTSSIDDSVDAGDIQDDLQEVVSLFTDKITSTKMPYARFSLNPIKYVDRLTLEQKVKVIIDKSTMQKVPESWSDVYSNTFIIKLNPKLSIEDNLDRCKSRLYVQVREWAYQIRKAFEDQINLSSMSVNSKFRGDKLALLKLPQWCRPLITALQDRGSNEWSDRYYATMDAFAEDPRQSSDPVVSFYAESINELKQQLADYKNNFDRINYDY